jgi:hypothetical protein
VPSRRFGLPVGSLHMYWSTICHSAKTLKTRQTRNEWAAEQKACAGRQIGAGSRFGWGTEVRLAQIWRILALLSVGESWRRRGHPPHSACSRCRRSRAAPSTGTRAWSRHSRTSAQGCGAGYPTPTATVDTIKRMGLFAYLLAHMRVCVFLFGRGRTEPFLSQAGQTTVPHLRLRDLGPADRTRACVPATRHYQYSSLGGLLCYLQTKAFIDTIFNYSPGSMRLAMGIVYVRSSVVSVNSCRCGRRACPSCTWMSGCARTCVLCSERAAGSFTRPWRCFESRKDGCRCFDSRSARSCDHCCKPQHWMGPNSDGIK